MCGEIMKMYSSIGQKQGNEPYSNCKIGEISNMKTEKCVENYVEITKKRDIQKILIVIYITRLHPNFVHGK